MRNETKPDETVKDESISSFILHPSFFPLRLSQTQLNLLETCPRKFQHTYLEQLGAPIDFEQQERLSQGSRFHSLMQQWQLGLPIEPLVKEDAQLNDWFTAFVNAAPEILKLDSLNLNSLKLDSLKLDSLKLGSLDEALRQSEHLRTLEFEGYLLTVIYDLLISTEQQAKILDWKTYPRPQNPRWLLQNWQTRLYPFVLAETSDYAPEAIAMTYWFFQSQGDQAEPQSLTIAYDTLKHEQTRQDLSHLLTQLTHWLEHYQSGEPFPQVAAGGRECERCSFTVRCSRETARNENREVKHEHDDPENQPRSQSDINPYVLPNLGDIQEVSL